MPHQETNFFGKDMDALTEIFNSGVIFIVLRRADAKNRVKLWPTAIIFLIEIISC